MRPDPAETRAEVARRRLAELTAAFESRMPPPSPEADETDDEQDNRPTAARPRIRPGHVRAVVALGVAGAVLVGWNLLSGRPGSTPADGSLAFAEAAPSATPTTAGATGAPATEVVVDVIGHVQRPGIVSLPAGSRVHEAVAAAGGLAGQVDTTSLNMARVLTDGEQIAVGIAPVMVGGPAAAATGSGGTSGPVNLNTATEEQLDALPGVGPVTATAILAWRTENGRFSSVEDLLEVRGIGEATLAELRDLVTV